MPLLPQGVFPPRCALQHHNNTLEQCPQPMARREPKSLLPFPESSRSLKNCHGGSRLKLPEERQQLRCCEQHGDASRDLQAGSGGFRLLTPKGTLVDFPPRAIAHLALIEGPANHLSSDCASSYRESFTPTASGSAL